MLKDEFEYFLKNKKELVDKYDGRFIVIKDQKVIGNYESELEAVEETSKDQEVGTFLVQKCKQGDDSVTQTFHSRVYFPTAK